MPGRQAHGRSLNAAPPKINNKKKTHARSQKNALNAFGIAQEQFPTRQKKTPRARELDAEFERKHGRDETGGGVDSEGEEDDPGPTRKKARGSSRVTDNPDAEHGSDSEGNEWQLGGMAEDDEDSEIESDDAFGDSDNEKFGDYTFRGSKSKGDAREDDSSDDENDDEGETLGDEAIDLATALDQYEDESDDIENGSASSGSDDSDSADSDNDSEGSDESDEDDDEEEADPQKLEALRGLVTDFGGKQQEEEPAARNTKQKIGLSELGLSGVSDPFMRKSVKLMNKEEKEKRPGAAKKLDVPLPRRQQGQIDRSAAYDKTNETLDRWTETVKQNRRAEHLVFPLPQNSAMAGVARNEIQPLQTKDSNYELESTIMSIMEQSGLSMDKPVKSREPQYDDDGNEMSRKDIANAKRRERELMSREAKRAKRIKKIKSKAYHRVHRKQREREGALEDGEDLDSEEEREAQDRRRALERVGQRHKESKWAKIGAKNKRAVWDDDFRTGLTEMARRDQELRRRKEGRAGASDDDDATSDSEDGDESLRRQLQELEEMEDEPQSKLMALKFMQKAEAARKKSNDELVQQIRRELDGDEGADSAEEEDAELGRQTFGGPRSSERNTDATSRNGDIRNEKKKQGNDEDDVDIIVNGASKGSKNPLSMATSRSDDPAAAAWSRGGSRRKNKLSGASAANTDIDINDLASLAVTKPKSRKPQAIDGEAEPDSDSDQHLPLAIRDQELLARAFGGADVVADFEQEKREIAEEDDDKVIDNTLPGWGSWVGEGVSNKEKNRHKGRFLTKVAGVKKKDRKDAKLDKVIINEKRVKKNGRYLASQLPHPFESRAQYERSLRLPVGPEWMTKESFQDGTKPRVLMKQGIITPMSKPSA